MIKVEDFESQLEELFKGNNGYKISFFVFDYEKENYKLELYDCWGIISKVGIQYAKENIKEVAEKVLENIKRIYRK